MQVMNKFCFGIPVLSDSQVRRIQTTAYPVHMDMAILDTTN